MLEDPKIIEEVPLGLADPGCPRVLEIADVEVIDLLPNVLTAELGNKLLAVPKVPEAEITRLRLRLEDSEPFEELPLVLKILELVENMLMLLITPVCCDACKNRSRS